MAVYIVIGKMNRVLKAGNSILIFPEGRWNDSENLLCQKLFAGPYNLSFQIYYGSGHCYLP